MPSIKPLTNQPRGSLTGLESAVPGWRRFSRRPAGITVLAVVLGLAACQLLASSGYARVDTAQKERPEGEGRPGVRLVGKPETKPEVIGAYLSLGYWHPLDVDRTFAELSECGVNLVIDYALSAPEDDGWSAEFQHYLDSAREHGIGVAFSLKDMLVGARPDNASDYTQRVLLVVRRLKDQPGITAWYVHDEILPSVSGMDGTTQYCLTLEQMTSLYRRIHAADPSRPQLCVWNFLPDYETFKLVCMPHMTYGTPRWTRDAESYEAGLATLLQGACDWVLIDSYPVGAPWRETPEQPCEDVVATMISRAASLKRADQPLYFVFQAMSWAQYVPEQAAGAPFPTADETLRMLDAAHRGGASGAIAYSWFDLTDPAPDKAIPGQEQALADLKSTLHGLAAQGWPETEQTGAGG